MAIFYVTMLIYQRGKSPCLLLHVASTVQPRYPYDLRIAEVLVGLVGLVGEMVG